MTNGKQILLPDDEKRLWALHHTRSPVVFASRLFDYYHDTNRADRTSRSLMYLHFGMVTARILTLAGQLAKAKQRKRR